MASNWAAQMAVAMVALSVDEWDETRALRRAADWAADSGGPTVDCWDTQKAEWKGLWMAELWGGM